MANFITLKSGSEIAARNIRLASDSIRSGKIEIQIESGAHAKIAVASIKSIRRHPHGGLVFECFDLSDVWAQTPVVKFVTETQLADCVLSGTSNGQEIQVDLATVDYVEMEDDCVRRIERMKETTTPF